MNTLKISKLKNRLKRIEIELAAPLSRDATIFDVQARGNRNRTLRTRREEILHQLEATP